MQAHAWLHEDAAAISHDIPGLPAMHDRWEDLALGAMHAQHIIQELATATLGVLRLASDA